MPDPKGDTPQHVIVGRVASAHGVSGGIRVNVLSDVPHRFDQGQTLQIGDRSYPITHSSPAPNGQVVLRLQDVDSVDAARRLVGQPATVPQSAVPPPREGEYYHFQLLGLKVLTDDGECLGRVREILETGSNDVLRRVRRIGRGADTRLDRRSLGSTLGRRLHGRKFDGRSPLTGFDQEYARC